MKYLDYAAVLRLYDRVLSVTGGSPGLRDEPLLRSALAQPRMTFGGEDLYPTLAEKAAALCFSLVKNHPFVDGNKRIAFAAMDALLRLNGYRLGGEDSEIESVILRLAASELEREEFTEWVALRITLRRPIDRGGQ